MAKANLGRFVSTRTLEERFWEKVDKTGDCWEWTGFKNRQGYGQFQVSTKNGQPAHRVSFELANGKIPDGMHVCHKCDNPPCVRPDHLFLGTPSDNMKDMVKKGRNISPNALKTHCAQGHEFSPENTMRINGCRFCRECGRQNQRRINARKKALKQSEADSATP